jgi:cytochrome P450
LRLGSPAPQVAPRFTVEDTEFSGVFIPKGTCVTVNMFNMHHSNKVWDNPEKFDPDRFEDDGDRIASPQMDWAPFGGGPRQCIGFNFSLNEQRVFLSMLCKFHFFYNRHCY